MHSLSGLNHLLAMIAVGIWSMQLSSHLDKGAIGLLPVIYVLAIALLHTSGIRLGLFWCITSGVINGCAMRA
jgi:hydrogenase/urease accessory protein HupE